jgi:hypothetical protein
MAVYAGFSPLDWAHAPCSWPALYFTYTCAHKQPWIRIHEQIGCLTKHVRYISSLFGLLAYSCAYQLTLVLMMLTLLLVMLCFQSQEQRKRHERLPGICVNQGLQRPPTSPHNPTGPVNYLEAAYTTQITARASVAYTRKLVLSLMLVFGAGTGARVTDGTCYSKTRYRKFWNFEIRFNNRSVGCLSRSWACLVVALLMTFCHHTYVPCTMHKQSTCTIRSKACDVYYVCLCACVAFTSVHLCLNWPGNCMFVLVCDIHVCKHIYIYIYIYTYTYMLAGATTATAAWACLHGLAYARVPCSGCVCVCICTWIYVRLFATWTCTLLSVGCAWGTVFWTQRQAHRKVMSDDDLGCRMSVGEWFWKRREVWPSVLWLCIVLLRMWRARTR